MKNLFRQIAESLTEMIELRYAARAQCDYDLEFSIVLPAPTNDRELYQRWSVPRDWCARSTSGTDGLWSRRRDRVTGELVFTFNDAANAELFKSRFGQ